MRRISLAFFMILVGQTALLSSAGMASSWQDVTNAVTAMNEAGKSRSEMVQTLLKQDKAALTETVARLRRAMNEERVRLEKIQQQLTHLKQEEQRLRLELSDEQDEIEGIQGTVLGAAKQINDLFEHSPIGSEMTAARQLLDGIMAKKSFPGMDEIRGLFALCNNYYRKSAQVSLYQGRYFACDGQIENGDIVRIGGLGAVFRTGKTVGYLKANSDGRELVAIGGQPPRKALQGIKRFMTGAQGHLPIDISGGAVFLQFTQGKSIMQWLESGGLLVWPILSIGAIAIFLAVERLIFFLRIRSDSGAILQNVTRLVQSNKIDSCLEYCERNKKFPTCQISAGCLQHIGESREVLENALEESLLKQAPRFERFLPTLSMFAAIAPLLGLLGTVTGMISTFQVINIFGTGDPKMMSGGISEALITTQVGLAVAIPILFLHHVFERRADNILADLEEKGNAFKITLTKTGRTLRNEDLNAA